MWQEHLVLPSRQKKRQNEGIEQIWVEVAEQKAQTPAYTGTVMSNCYPTYTSPSLLKALKAVCGGREIILLHFKVLIKEQQYIYCHMLFMLVRAYMRRHLPSFCILHKI